MISDSLNTLLERANTEPVAVPQDVADDFGDMCKRALKRQFEEQRETDFRLRVSNLGKPLCQLKLEAAQTRREAPSTFFKVKMTYGDLTEAFAVAALKLAGVKILSQFQPVELEIAGEIIRGTYDVIIEENSEPVLYDIKSSSEWALENKFSEAAGGFDTLVKNDQFGYVVQGFAYARALGIRFGGLICIGKETGTIVVMPVTEDYKKAEADAYAIMERNVLALKNKEPFERCFTDVKEKFKKAETGNRILGSTCRWCSYKFSCWPNLVMKLDVNSKAQNPAVKYYTHLASE